jgi:serine protease Do
MLNTILLPRRAGTIAVGAFAVLLLMCATGPNALQAAQLWKDGSSIEFEQPQLPAFSEAAKALKPAVVNISSRRAAPTEERRSSRRRPFPFGGEDPFQEFFDRFFGEQRRPRNRPSLGTGFIINTNGYIVTNNHVVEEADEITVTLASQEEFDATLIGRDPKTDLALLRVDSPLPLPTVPFGDSENLEVGEWVLAIGNPFGLGHTVTAGIVSAKGRIIGAGPYDDFIQTDASINPGNSGGPLFNMRGEVIGINTAIISRTGGYDGIGFALPSNIAVKTYNQIIRYGRVTRGSIGVQFSADNPSLSRSYGAEGGVFVEKTVDGGPAEKAGMRDEDIIVSVDGTKIDSGEKLIEVVAAISVGETVPIEVVRDGKKLTLDVKIADRLKLYPEQAEVRPQEDEEEEASVRFGITVQEVSPERRERMRLSGSGGILVTKVERGSFAERIQLRPGDVVLAVNRVEISSTRELRTIQKNLTPGSDVSFKVLRSNGREWRTVYLAGLLSE